MVAGDRKQDLFSGYGNHRRRGLFRSPPTPADTHMDVRPAFHRSFERRILGNHEAEEDYFVR